MPVLSSLYNNYNNLHNNPMRWSLLLSPHYIWETETERLSVSPEVTQLVSSGAQVWTQAVWLQSPCWSQRSLLLLVSMNLEVISWNLFIRYLSNVYYVFGTGDTTVNNTDLWLYGTYILMKEIRIVNKINKSFGGLDGKCCGGRDDV